MADKIAAGSWAEGPPPPQRAKATGKADPAVVERLQARRDGARWSAVVGFGLMFGASLYTGFLLGGAGMVLYGASASVYWSWRLRKTLGDPWDYDPELDGPQAPGWSREGRPPSRADVEREDGDG